MHQLKTLQAEHPHANHIAFAYRIKTNEGIIYRFHDAGEPTGTAGKPIFQYIEGKNIINVFIVVIRYFGGVKLGVLRPTIFKAIHPFLFEVRQCRLTRAIIGRMHTEDSARQNTRF